jgi:hypothetical protein
VQKKALESANNLWINIVPKKLHKRKDFQKGVSRRKNEETSTAKKCGPLFVKWSPLCVQWDRMQLVALIREVDSDLSSDFHFLKIGRICLQILMREPALWEW